MHQFCTKGYWRILRTGGHKYYRHLRKITDPRAQKVILIKIHLGVKIYLFVTNTLSTWPRRDLARMLQEYFADWGVTNLVFTFFIENPKMKIFYFVFVSFLEKKCSRTSVFSCKRIFSTQNWKAFIQSVCKIV